MELNTLFPNHCVVLSDKTVIDINPFTFGQLPKAISLSKDIFHIAREMYESKSTQTEMIGELFAVGGENFIELVAMSINKPRSWFDSLPADDGLNIATMFLEVNLSFFAQKVLPALKTGMDRLQKTAPGLMQ